MGVCISRTTNGDESPFVHRTRLFDRGDTKEHRGVSTRGAVTSRGAEWGPRRGRLHLTDRYLNKGTYLDPPYPFTLTYAPDDVTRGPMGIPYCRGVKLKPSQGPHISSVDCPRARTT